MVERVHCNHQPPSGGCNKKGEPLYDVIFLTQSVPIEDLSAQKKVATALIKANAALGASFVHEAEISDFLTPVPVHKPSSERLLYTIQETSV